MSGCPNPTCVRHLDAVTSVPSAAAPRWRMLLSQTDKNTSGACGMRAWARCCIPLSPSRL
eukprot:2514176-Rhodomonas_salina.1